MPAGLIRDARGALLALLVCAAALAACTAPPVLTAILGPAVTPAPVAGQARRPPYKPYAERTMDYKLLPPSRTDWLARLQELPKDDAGNVDWVGAFKDARITPKASISGDKSEEDVVLDLDVELTPPDMPDFKATFPHKQHTQILACANCHTGIFQMEKGADPITMEKILAGQYCGRCHGPVAFDPTTACPRCHLSMPK